MPPGSPFACPSGLQGLGWGIWLVLWRKNSTKNYSIVTFQVLLCISISVYEIYLLVQLTVCAPGGCAGPEWRVHARPSLSPKQKEGWQRAGFPCLLLLTRLATTDYTTEREIKRFMQFHTRVHVKQNLNISLGDVCPPRCIWTYLRRNPTTKYAMDSD